MKVPYQGNWAHCEGLLAIQEGYPSRGRPLVELVYRMGMHLFALSVVSIAIAHSTLCAQIQLSPSEPSQEQELPALALPNTLVQCVEPADSTGISLVKDRVAPLEDKENVEAEFAKLREAAEKGFEDLQEAADKGFCHRSELYEEPLILREKVYQRSCDIIRVLFRVKLKDILVGSNDRSEELHFILYHFRSAALKLRSKVFGEFRSNIDFLYPPMAKILTYPNSSLEALTEGVHKALDEQRREELLEIASKLIFNFVIYGLSFSNAIMPVNDPQKITLPLRQFLAELSSREALNVSKWVLRISSTNPHFVCHRFWKN